MNILDNLKEQGVSESLIKDIEHFRKEYDVKDELKERVTKSPAFFIGKDILEMCITGILEEENILLSGPKATGKNLLSDNLSEIFGRPQWNTSFHINTDSASLIGTDTFIDNEVKLRRGSVYECAVNGGFGIFDEINMAKNDAIVVLHSALDYRRVIDECSDKKVISKAQGNLAIILWNEINSESDKLTVIQLYKESIKNGNEVSMYNLGKIFDDGNKVDRDYLVAYDYYRMAAEHNYPDAQAELGWMYEKGHGVPQDYYKSSYWYNLAAKNNHLVAMVNLGNHYMNGNGVECNKEKGFSLYMRAYALRKNDESIPTLLYLIANSYEFGNGVARDCQEAIRWYERARDAGNPDSQLCIDRLLNCIVQL